MRNEFTAILEYAEGWYIAYYPEMSGANGQGRIKDEASNNLGSPEIRRTFLRFNLYITEC